ncbi:MAG: glycoside hydrolase family 13 protein [Anaerolineales bacterium]
MSVPAWIHDAIFYQIFPDRFENGDLNNDPSNKVPWGSEPSIWGFQGGDLRGVIQRLDYIQDLGANAIYLNPIFESSSNHRYNTRDYYRIDPKLGGMEDFEELLRSAHNHGIRVILDGVFNHCGRGFFAFNDVLENQAQSAYKDWFYIKRFPVRAYGRGKADDYEAWWKFKSLPKLNIQNPEVRAYILQVAKFWLEKGVDGWRLDVPTEIADMDFWSEFRAAAKNVNNDAYLLGEIWEIEPDWVGPEIFDGLMNYPLRDALLDLLTSPGGALNMFVEAIETLLGAYPTENTNAHYLPLGSHDTVRLATALKSDEQRILTAFTFQFFFPGAPAIYYGDEVGLKGGKDPDNRRAFIWEKDTWNHKIREHLENLVSLRSELPQLRRGEFQIVSVDEVAGVATFRRIYKDRAAVLVMNISSTSQQINLPYDLLRKSNSSGDINSLLRSEFIEQGPDLLIRIPPCTADIVYS